MNLSKIATAFAAVLLASQPTFAGEWQADRLRGVVLTMVDDTWTPISIGDVIEDSRLIRTGANGHVTFRSGEQVLEMRPNTQIQISSREGRDYTWVLHSGGEVTADVEALNVEHFGIQTHHMVAVVKGTRFTVVADENGGNVAVERGTVSVTENERGLSVAISEGQRAVGGAGRLEVEGQGALPTVVDAAGRPVMPTSAQANVVPNGANSFDDAPGRTGDAPGNSGNAPGRTGDAPGNSGNAPGRTGDAPGNSGNAPGRTDDAPGNSGSAPGRTGDAPGNSGSAPGRTGDAPGNSGNAPERTGDAPGNSGNAPGRTGDAPGNSGNAPGNGIGRS
ncbi:FecR domain-containing protein [Pelagibacterium sp.]|uniref:FecR domain-containing protein n=1 Tax=Pelagibacterium sp. TaxID=1967288 RepID=UPI003A9063BD